MNAAPDPNADLIGFTVACSIPAEGKIRVDETCDWDPSYVNCTMLTKRGQEIPTVRKAAHMRRAMERRA